MFLLTGNILTKISPSLKGKFADDIAAWHTEVCPLYGINNADILHEFIANELHESNSFTDLSEGLNYQTDALAKLFSSSRISHDEIYEYGRRRLPNGTIKPANQQAIANCIYGGEWGRKHLGNIYPNDGWDMRGAGPMQNTGRGNITAFTKYYNKLTGSEYTPELMASKLRVDVKLGIHSACWFFSIAKGLNKAALADKFEAIVEKINGAKFGMPARMEFYESSKRLIA